MLAFVLSTGEPYVYMMGHFPAPWGNEIRVGVLEASMAVFFCVIMFLCMIGGSRERELEIEESKMNLYYVMVNLLLCSLLALIYTCLLYTSGQQSIEFQEAPHIISSASVVGPKEGEGPLGEWFDLVAPDEMCIRDRSFLSHPQSQAHTRSA